MPERAIRMAKGNSLADSSGTVQENVHRDERSGVEERLLERIRVAKPSEDVLVRRHAVARRRALQHVAGQMFREDPLDLRGLRERVRGGKRKDQDAVAAQPAHDGRAARNDERREGEKIEVEDEVELPRRCSTASSTSGAAPGARSIEPSRFSRSR